MSFLGLHPLHPYFWIFALINPFSHDALVLALLQTRSVSPIMDQLSQPYTARALESSEFHKYANTNISIFRNSLDQANGIKLY
jgi:hypothetical protein